MKIKITLSTELGEDEELSQEYELNILPSSLERVKEQLYYFVQKHREPYQEKV